MLNFIEMRLDVKSYISRVGMGGGDHKIFCQKIPGSCNHSMTFLIGWDTKWRESSLFSLGLFMHSKYLFYSTSQALMPQRGTDAKGFGQESNLRLNWQVFLPGWGIRR